MDPQSNSRPYSPRSELLGSLRYIASSIDEDGRFPYRLNPSTGEVNQDTYNVVRHAAVLEVLSDFNDVTFRRSASLASTYSDARTFPLPGHVGTAGICDSLGRFNLGATALTAAAFARSGDLARRDALERLINFLHVSQLPDGSFWCRRLVNGCPDDHRSLYYEGEAAYALGVIYELTGNERLLPSFRSAVEFLCSKTLKAMERLDQHWTLKALRISVRCEVWKSEHFSDEIALALFDLSDYLRSHHATASTGMLATKAECLWALGDIFRMSRKDRRSGRCFNEARWLSTLLLERQYRTGPARGGFCYSLTKPFVRIDVVQHAATALAEQLSHSS